MSASALVMGVLNVTPDSFSDGGRWTDAADAVAWGLRLFAEGADIVDVGGESTRPGAAPVDAAEELRRVLPVVRALAPLGRVSIDTRNADVAEAAVSVGATIINDVSASLAEVAGFMGVGYVVMHMQGEPLTMQVAPRYDDVVTEVHEFLAERADEARELGASEVWVDPGIGFGKSLHHNLELLAALPALVAAGTPVLIGASRKGFLGALTGDAPVDDRLEASLAVATWAYAQGVQVVRAHDVEPTVHAARIVTGTATTGAAA
jgi:dihydropteroate synthase